MQKFLVNIMEGKVTYSTKNSKSHTLCLHCTLFTPSVFHILFFFFTVITLPHTLPCVLEQITSRQFLPTSLLVWNPSYIPTYLALLSRYLLSFHPLSLHTNIILTSKSPQMREIESRALTWLLLKWGLKLQGNTHWIF